MRKVGVEIEVSDIRVVEAARLVFEATDRDFKTWEDRWGPYSKPKLKYDRWNVVSDGSLYNTDGSRCMWTYLEGGQMKKASSSKSSGDRDKWLGAELVSPATEDVDKLVSEMQMLINLLVENGATMTRKNVNAFHVHIDISDLEFENLKRWPRLIYEMQDTFDILSTKWKKRAFYTLEEIERLEQCNDAKKFWEEYRYIKGRIRHGNFDGHRRLLDIGPWFNVEKSYKTIEFRGFSATKNVQHMSSCIKLALDTVEHLSRGEVVPDLEQRIAEMESQYVPSY
jgi:hypothetical protein